MRGRTPHRHGRALRRAPEYGRRNAIVAVTMLLAVSVPLLFLYAVHWLDLYGTDRPRIIVQCVLWGVAAFGIAFTVNHFFLDVVAVSRPVLSTRIAPVVEEVAKALVLAWLVRRGRLHNPVDGAIYGFASGVGFAAVENLRYMQLFPDNALWLMVLRDFSSALSHGTSAGLAGIALGSLSLRSRRARRLGLVLGLGGAMALHALWNNFAYFSPFARTVTEWTLVSVALLGVAAIALAILLNLRHERAQLQEAIGSKVGISVQETHVLRHLDDVDRLLQPIVRRFGAATAARVCTFLHVEARLELAQACRERTSDAEMAAALLREVAELQRDLDGRRRALGVYVMLHVRSILPDATWSVWLRVPRRPASTTLDAGALWRRLGERCGGGSADRGMYARLQAELAQRPRAAPQHAGLDELPESLRACVHYVSSEVAVTARHAAERLGWHEGHAHAMLADLVARGFLHRTMEAGTERFRALAHAQVHVWHAVRQEPRRESA